jgi:hypothetical protein
MRNILLCALCVTCGGLFAENNKKTVQTPFGSTVRSEPAPRRPPDFSTIKVEEKSDTFTFRRPTPFGDSVWKRQRGELTPLEREIVAAQAAKNGKK